MELKKEKATLIIFVGALLITLVLKLELLYALGFGFILFAIYSFTDGFSLKDIAKMAIDGLNTIKTTCIVFALVGAMTALWRGSGTIASIIYYCSGFIAPKYFLLITFLLTSLVSFLIGTSFGTAATVGSICIAIANSLNINPMLVGGAMLSGCFFGDRMSYVSTSALFVADISKTNLFNNIKLMLKTCIIPFIITCNIYFFLGIVLIEDGMIDNSMFALFNKEYTISLICLLPALVIIVLALFKVDIKLIIVVSVIVSIILIIAIQNVDISSICKTMIFGYTSKTEELAKLLDGGGVVSMIKAILIVGISNSYSGFFNKTNLIKPLKDIIKKIYSKCSKFLTLIIVSFIVSAIVCNQMFAIALCGQLIKDIYDDPQELAIDLENSVVVIAPLIPWSIASMNPLSSAGAPTVSIVFAFYLMVLPLFTYLNKKLKAY